MKIVQQSVELEFITPERDAAHRACRQIVIVLPLSQGREASIDDCDRRLAKYKWSWLRSRVPSGYAVRSDRESSSIYIMLC